MIWEFDQLTKSWDLYVDNLSFEVRGKAVAIAWRDERSGFWHASVFAEEIPGRWNEAELAKARAVIVLLQKLRDAVDEVDAGRRAGGSARVRARRKEKTRNSC